MKIKKLITDTAKISVENCRMALTSSVIELCKKTGIDPSVDIQFTKPLLISTTNAVSRKGKFSHYETENVLVDRISWSPGQNFFLLWWNGDCKKSSIWLTLDGLCVVYDEMKSVLKRL